MLSARTTFWFFLISICAGLSVYFSNKYIVTDEPFVRHTILTRGIYRSDELMIDVNNAKESISIHCKYINGVAMLDLGALVRADSNRLSLVFDALSAFSLRERISKRKRERRGLSLKDYGFDNPRAKITLLKDGKQVVQLLIGADAPYDGAVFVMADDMSDIYVVDRYLYDILPKSYEDVRDKSIYPFQDFDISQIDVKTYSSDYFSLVSTKYGWMLNKPIQAPASEAVDALLNSLTSSISEEFVWTPKTEDITKAALEESLLPYRLSANDAVASIMIWKKGSQVPFVTYRFGKESVEKPNCVYAYSSVDNSVFLVDRTVPEAFMMGSDEMRRRRLIPEGVTDVVSFSISGKDSVTRFERTDDLGWNISLPSKQKADNELVNKFLSSIFMIEDKGLSFVQTNFVSEVTLSSKLEDGRNIDLSFGSLEGQTDLFARVGDDSFYRIVPFDVMPIGFFDENFVAGLRSKEVVSFDKELLYGISLVQKTDGIEVQENYDIRENDVIVCSVTANGMSSNGVQIEPDREQLSALIERMTNLQALSVVSMNSENARNYGLLSPKREVMFRLNEIDASSQSFIIEVGDASSNGGYIRMKGEESIFEVDEELYSLLLGHFYKNKTK